MHEPKTILSQERIMVDADFITRNRLQLRTQGEIVDRYKRENDSDRFFNFVPEVLTEHMNLESVMPYLTVEGKAKYAAEPEAWEFVDSVDVAAQDFLDYMNFAWGKAEDERGISASRSVDKLGAWLWLLNRGDLEKVLHQDDLYNPYGAPALIAVCDQMGIAVPDSLREFAQEKCED